MSMKVVIYLEMDLARYFFTQGPFAVLFVWLLIYVMKNNKERENRLYNTLDKFSEKYDIIIDEIRDIKQEMMR